MRITGQKVTLMLNGTPVEDMQEVSYSLEESGRPPTFDGHHYEFTFKVEGVDRVFRALDRIRIEIAHAANLLNPRWLKRRARMRRKKARGYA